MRRVPFYWILATLAGSTLSAHAANEISMYAWNTANTRPSTPIQQFNGGADIDVTIAAIDNIVQFVANNVNSDSIGHITIRSDRDPNATPAGKQLKVLIAGLADSDLNAQPDLPM